MQNGNFNFNGNKEKSPFRKHIFFGITTILLLALIFGWGGRFQELFYAVIGSLTALLIAAILAFLFSRFVDFFENKVMKKAFVGSKRGPSYKRAISLLLVFVIICSIIALLLWLIIPRVVEIIKELAENPGGYSSKIAEELTEMLRKLLGADLGKEITKFISDMEKTITETIVALGDQVLEIGTTVLLTVGIGLLSILFTILMIKDKEKINDFFKRVTYANNTPQRADEIMQIKKKSSDILYSYFLSKFIEMAILSVLIGITFAIIGVPYALPLAILISVFNFIPYIGILIGLVPALAITIIFGNMTQALYVIISSVVIVIGVTSGVTPFIVGKQIKISGLLVGASILIGGAAFGMLGMLFAPPLFAIINVIWIENLEIKEKRQAMLLQQAEITAVAETPPVEEKPKRTRKKTIKAEEPKIEETKIEEFKPKAKTTKINTEEVKTEEAKPKAKTTRNKKE